MHHNNDSTQPGFVLRHLAIVIIALVVLVGLYLLTRNMTTSSLGVVVIVLAHIIAIAGVLGLLEFFADKIPYVDSAWDGIHTFIRPAGGIALGYLAMVDAGPAIQYPVALLTGSIALDSHLTKATSRAAINTSPEPFTNTVASVTEDVGVVGALYLVIKHPVVATFLVILFIIFSIWFLRKMFHLLKKVLSREKVEPSGQAQTQTVSNPQKGGSS